MSADELTVIMPYIMESFIAEVVKRQNISEKEALLRIYKSSLYALLEDEKTKVWQYSTDMLYSLFEQEQLTGKIDFPDV